MLLKLPVSVRDTATVSWTDALFTSTSAVCVTGLIAVDTADTFTPFGQAVVVALIQVGGLGVTSIGMGLALAAGRRISLRGRTLVREALNVDSLEGMIRLVRAVILLTACFELAGVVCSFPVFVQDFPPLHALWISIFHSVAAFNNSGFDILGGLAQPDPLPRQRLAQPGHLCADHFRRHRLPGHDGRGQMPVSGSANTPCTPRWCSPPRRYCWLWAPCCCS